MAEMELTAAQADALAGTTDEDTGFKHHTIGESAYYTEGFRQRHRVLAILKVINELRVYKDGAMTFGVRPGRFMDGTTVRNYAGATGQALTDDATNYIYLTAGGSLTVNTSGLPDPSATPHIPLATIAVASGGYAHDDIVDSRGRSLWGILSAMTAAGANTLAGGGSSVADSLHVHDTAGVKDAAVTAAKLAAAVQDLLPNLSITAGAENADVRRITIQACDAANNDLAERLLIRLWVATSDFGAPNATGNTYALVTGTAYATETANAAYKVISDANGKVEFDLTIAGAATRYVMAEIDGWIYSSAALNWTA